jgi:hypothetical protein
LPVTLAEEEEEEEEEVELEVEEEEEEDEDEEEENTAVSGLEEAQLLSTTVTSVVQPFSCLK